MSSFSNFSLHNLNNSIFFSNKCLKMLTFSNFLSQELGKFIKSLNKVVLVNSQSLDVLLISVDVSVQIINLAIVQFNLFISVNLLLSNDVKLSNLIINNFLSFI
jgi:hypothetical protein